VRASLDAADASLDPSLAVLAAACEDHGVVEFLILPQESAATQPSPASIAGRMKDVAARHPHSLPMQIALIQSQLRRGELPEAAAIAERAMRAFPDNTDPARLATSIYTMARQWDRAAAAAREWLQRSAENPQPPSIALAEIELSRGDANAAVKALQPFVKQVTTNPQSQPDLTAALLRAYAAAGRDNEARDILQPLLPRDRSWRVLWVKIASNQIRDAAIAAAWIRQVEPMISDHVECVELGRAWYAVAVRGAGESAYESAAKALDPIVARPDAPGDAVLLRGVIADRAGDFKTAEMNYRRGLQITPRQPEAMNNLAYLILQTGGDLAEAKKLASEAVNLSPTTASFLDTLARIQAKTGERDSAVATFQKALTLEPNSLDALIGLASTLLDSGKRDSAAKALSQIDVVLKSKAPATALPDQQRKELDALRATVKASL